MDDKIKKAQVLAILFAVALTFVIVTLFFYTLCIQVSIPFSPLATILFSVFNFFVILRKVQPGKGKTNISKRMVIFLLIAVLLSAILLYMIISGVKFR